jgi:hypothetical protein
MKQEKASKDLSSLNNPTLTKEMITERNIFHLKQLISPLPGRSNKNWEEITCVGYNPNSRRLEAVVSIKQSAGYNGSLCSTASLEHIRFFVDFKDGGGYRDMGLTNFKVADISDAPPGAQHPLKYMASIFLDDAKYRRFTDCHHAVIPRVRAILSWNTIPDGNPDQTPHYGNVFEADIQLLKKTLLVSSVIDINKNLNLSKFIDWDAPIPTKVPPVPEVASILEIYKKAEVPAHRTFFSTVGSLIHSNMNFSKATALFNFHDIKKLDINIADLLPFYNTDQHNANISFEELTCVGLNTETDTLGAVIHVKKANGYSGDLCHKGSTEHVAFWADWNNNGTFDEYLGTQSFEIHDISNIPATGLYYNVSMPLNVSGKLKSCSSPNIIKIRAVLSWEALPSTTNPNALNTWGNSKDSLVQLRPGQSSGIYAVLTRVGNADRVLIHPTAHLYNYNSVAPGTSNNRPWGGVVNFKGIIDKNGFAGIVKYRIRYKEALASDLTYKTVATSESNSLVNTLLPYPLCFFSNTQLADADGWFVYQVDAPGHIFSNDDNHLADWSTAGLTDGTYTIRFEYTDEVGTEIIDDEFSIIITNKGMSVSLTANPSVDPAYSLDLVIDGGDCHSYTPSDSVIHGHVKAVHDYFASWTLKLEPSSHNHDIKPSPESRSYSSLGFTGDANFPWTLDTETDDAKLDPCGYTVSLTASTRVILNSDHDFPLYGPKAVGFAKLP